MVTGYETFEGWYKQGGEGSGPGSSVDYTVRWRAFLQDFMEKHRISSVFDYGCGDWEWAKLVEWPAYDGVDLFPDLIESLQAKYGARDRKFYSVSPDSWRVSHRYDLVICKDVIQHLPLSEARTLVAKLRAVGKRCLIVNDVGSHNNAECPRGGYRTIDLSAPPFSVPGSIVFDFGAHPEWRKVAFQAEGT